MHPAVPTGKRSPSTIALPLVDSVNEETRSSSPHCPKPDEPEEPLGTAMETEAAPNGQSLWSTGAPRGECDVVYHRKRVRSYLKC